MRGNAPPRTLPPGLMVLPCLALLAVFVFWPVVRSVELSLFASDLVGLPRQFVGLDNVRALLASSTFWRALLTTLGIAAAATVLAIGAALVAGLTLRTVVRPVRGVLSVLFSLPFAYSAAAASAVFAGLFAPSVGTVNDLLALVGLPGPDWLLSPGWAVASIVFATAWYEFGFSFLVLLAALSTLDRSVLEAAALDGAGEWRTAVSVIVPSLRPSLLFLLVTQTIAGLQLFTQVQILTRGGPGEATTTLVHLLYQRAFGDALPDYGAASALALLLIVLVLAVVLLQLRLGREA